MNRASIRMSAALALCAFLATFPISRALADSLPQTMQAIRYDTAAGAGALKLETVAVPVPQAGQVLVKVYAASVNPSDWLVGTPRPPGAGPPPGPPPGGARMLGPRNPGNDLAGVVVAIGPYVTDVKVDDAVIAALQQIGGGAYAEYALCLDAVLAPKPKNFTYEQAAGIPTAGFTGLRMVLLANVQKGERVLVIGAAGGVGSTAVQVAKSRGAYVIASASSIHNDYLKSLGVDEIVNYDKDAVGDKLKDVDVVINSVGSENAAAISYVRKGGRIIDIAGQADPAACAAAGVSCSSGGPGQGPSDRELMRTLVQLANAGQYSVKVEKAFPLPDTSAAYAYGRSGNREGKLIITVNAGAAKP